MCPLSPAPTETLSHIDSISLVLDMHPSYDSSVLSSETMMNGAQNLEDTTKDYSGKLPPGVRVMLTGLKSHPEMNGAKEPSPPLEHAQQ